MPGYLSNPEIWKALWPLLLFPLGSAFFLCFLLRARPYKANVPAVYALSLLGMVIGEITGLSRAPAVASVLPAVLGLFGGVMVYLIGTKGKQLQNLVVIAETGLILNLLVGIHWGGYSRDVYEAYVKSPEVLAAQALAKENARYAAALQRLLDDQEYAKLKAQLENSK